MRNVSSSQPRVLSLSFLILTPSQLTMLDLNNMVAVPNFLCEWCNKSIHALRPYISQGLETTRPLFHYPNVEAFVRGTLEQRCHLCSIFMGVMMRHEETSDVIKFVKESEWYEGWCFQEQFLSPRSIYFGSKGIHWECRRYVLCEHLDHTNHGDIGLSLLSPRKSSFMKLMSWNNDISEPETSYMVQEFWRDVIHEYSRTHLTYSSDRLIALAGIATIFERKFRIRASFGLWLEFFLDELLWFVPFSRGSVRHHIAPSWAWASLHGSPVNKVVAFSIGDTDAECVVNCFSAKLVSLPRTTGFAPLGQSMKHENSHSFRLRGYLTRCVHYRGRGSLADGDLDPLHHEGTDDRRIFGRYYPDTSNEEKDLYCFLLKRDYQRRLNTSTPGQEGSDMAYDHCLVLAPIGGSQARFRRVGYYSEELDAHQMRCSAMDVSLSAMRTRLFVGAMEEQEIEII
jgi:hypothetical protein